MKTAKKVLGVVVALTMLINVFAMMSFALTPDTAIDLLISADKTSYNPGDVVTFTISIETADDITELMLNGNYAIAYDGSAISPIGEVDDLASYNIHNIQPGYDDTISGVFPLTVENCSGHLEWDEDEWNAGVMLSLADDATRFPVDGKFDMLTFQMKIKDDAKPGDYIVGYNGSLYASYDAYLNGYFGATGEESGVSQANTFGYGRTTIHVNGDTASSPVQYSKAQIRFHGVSAGNFENYQNQFDVRTVAKISEADFNATFTDEATAKEKITDFGFVYATTSNVPSFDVATAKQVAEGGSADNYVKKSVTYMQHASSGADYIFTCLISDIPDADKTDGVSCLGYVCFDGTYYYFDAAAKADFNTLYTTYFQG